MSQFKPMEDSNMKIYQVLLENILDEVYELLVNILLKWHSKSCGRNIDLFDDA